MMTRDTSQLVEYTMQLERENRELKARMASMRKEHDRLVGKYRTMREMAADAEGRTPGQWTEGAA